MKNKKMFILKIKYLKLRAQWMSLTEQWAWLKRGLVN